MPRNLSQKGRTDSHISRNVVEIGQLAADQRRSVITLQRRAANQRLEDRLLQRRGLMSAEERQQKKHSVVNTVAQSSPSFRLSSDDEALTMSHRVQVEALRASKAHAKKVELQRARSANRLRDRMVARENAKS